MMRFFLLLVSLSAIPTMTHAANGHTYSTQVHGSVAGFRLAGIEPDGDPLDQVILDTTLSAIGRVPRLHLIVDTYLENFQPDTTPILPDLLHPNQTAHNLGGFLQGKALITDNAGDVLYLGSFLAEAFLNNQNHAVMNLAGSGTAYGTGAILKGTFRLHHDGSLSGYFHGQISLTSAALRQVASHASARMRPIKSIISTVTVQPHAMVGRSVTKSSGVPLHTGFGRPATHSTSQSMITVAAAAGVGFFLLASLVLYLRKRTP
jgi:hypothetical protein